MATKQKNRRVVRKTPDDNPPPIAKPMPPGAVPQSPLPVQLEAQAQQLIHEAGSPTAAKSAVDVAAKREQLPDFQEDHFAQRFGFSSRAALRDASKPLTAPNGAAWWATALPDDRWVVWNKEHMAAADTFGSIEDAEASLNGSEY